MPACRRRPLRLGTQWRTSRSRHATAKPSGLRDVYGAYRDRTGDLRLRRSARTALARALPERATVPPYRVSGGEVRLPTPFEREGSRVRLSLQISEDGEHTAIVLRCRGE